MSQKNIGGGVLYKNFSIFTPDIRPLVLYIASNKQEFLMYFWRITCFILVPWWMGASLVGQTNPTPPATTHWAALSPEQLLSDLYGAQLRQTDADCQRQLARRLLDEAMAAGPQSPLGLALLRQAGQCAASGADPLTFLRCWEAELGGSQSRQSLPSDLARLGQTCRKLADVEALVEVCRILADDAMRRDQPEVPPALDQIAAAAAQRARSAHLLNQSAQRQREHQQWLTRRGQLDAARQRQQTGQATADDFFQLGLLQAVCLDDWAKADELWEHAAAPWSEAASLDRAGAEEWQAQMELGHRWWQLSQSRIDAAAADALRGRAVHWYQIALEPSLGLPRQLALKRISEQRRLRLLDRGYRPGLDTLLYAAADFTHLAGQRTDNTIDFDWGMNSPDARLPKDDFSLECRGYLLVPRDGNYTFVLSANEGFTLQLDGQTIMEQQGNARSRGGCRQRISLAGGCHRLLLRYFDHSGTARLRMEWIPPGELAAAPIGPEYFWRDAVR